MKQVQFKHSASVKLLSKITGLSMDGAYWLAAGLNFAIVIGVIAWMSGKHLPATFRIGLPIFKDRWRRHAAPARTQTAGFLILNQDLGAWTTK